MGMAALLRRQCSGEVTWVHHAWPSLCKNDRFLGGYKGALGSYGQESEGLSDENVVLHPWIGRGGVSGIQDEWGFVDQSEIINVGMVGHDDDEVRLLKHIVVKVT